MLFKFSIWYSDSFENSLVLGGKKTYMDGVGPAL